MRADLGLSAAPCLTGGGIIYLDGDPDDYVHPGFETIHTQPSQWVSFTPFYEYGDTFDQSWNQGLGMAVFWDIAFSSHELGLPLTVGRYDNAERYPVEDPGHPGLQIFGDTNGCNTVTGWFEIEEISIPDGGSARSLTATFEQHCEGAAPALRGCVHYEAN